jgi:hypothetical protein
MYATQPAEGDRTMSRSIEKSESGMALVTALITAVVLVTMAAAALTYSRSDAMVSDNSKHGSGAVWIAQLGAERAKNELRDSDSARHWTKIASSTNFYTSGTTYSGMPGAAYDTTVAPYGVAGSGKFLIQANGTAPDGSSVAIEEVVSFAGAALDLAAINIQGTGTHTKLDGGNNYGIPSYFIDGRNHDRNGIVCGADVDGDSISDSATCTTVSAPKPAIRGTTTTINNDVANELGNLKQHIVNDATQGGTCSGAASCNAPKTSNTIQNAGSWWIRNSSGLSATNCTQSDAISNPACYWNLDLADVRLNATGHPSGSPPVEANASGDTLWNVMFRGPVIGGTLGYAVNGVEDNALRDAIQQILNYAVNSNVGDRVAISSHITTDQTWGTWAHPKVVIACEAANHPNAKMVRLGQEPPCNGNAAPNNLNVDNNAVVTGTGLLIVGRDLELRDTRFNWRGIILILQQGRLQIRSGGNPDTRGMILGTVVVQDDVGSDPKLKLAYLTQTNSIANAFMNDPTPGSHSSVYDTIYGFGVKYSAEAVANALSGAMTTLSWRESYRGE